MITLCFDPFPVITTARLVLRKTLLEDAPEILTLRSDASVMQYLDKAPATSLEDAAGFINRITVSLEHEEGINWAITTRDSDTLIGNICLWRIQHENARAELGYSLLPEHHGKGLMSEAVAAVLHYGFNTMRLHSVEGHINPANLPSQKVLERAGFTREAYFRESHFYDGKFFDRAVYSLPATAMEIKGPSAV